MKINQVRNVLLSAAAPVALLMPSLASAQETTSPEAEDNSGIKEIIVTAERRETAAQKTPIALAVISGDQLELRQVQGIEALSAITPNVRFFETVQQAFITIRGVGGERNTTPAGDPSVALHVDGIYQARNNSANSMFYDVERVEVLRGPQGTLYGRNATGGAINIVSRRPNLTEFLVEGDALLGNYDRRQFRGIVNAPIVQDKLALRISGISEKRDGFVKNLAFPDGSADFQDSDTWGFKGQLLFVPSDRITITLRSDYSESDAIGTTDEAITPFRNPAISAPASVGGYGAPPEPAAPFLTNQDVRQFARNKKFGISGQLDVEDVFNTATWTTIVGYRDTEVDNRSEADKTAARLQSLDTTFDNEQLSIESRLATSSGDSFNWVLGAFYIKEDNVAKPFLFTYLPNGVTAATSDISMFVKAESVAVFGQATIALSDRFRLTGGLRYTHDSKDVTQRFVINSIQLPAPINVTVPGKRSWSAVTGKGGFEFDVGSQNLIYGSVTRGYKAGGFGLNQPAYDPEFIWAYELGSKNRFLDNKLQVNISAFHYQQRDQQIGIYADGLLPGAPSVLVQNAAKSRTWGAEVEFQAVPTDGLTIDGSISYLDAKYDRYSSVDPYDPIRAIPACAAVPPTTPVAAIPTACLNTVVLDGRSQTLAPKWSAQAGIQYVIELGSVGKLTPRADVSLTSDYLLRQYGRLEDRQDGYINVDLALRWNSVSDKFSLELFAKNLTNEKVIASSSFIPSSRSLGVIYLPPRTYGISAGFRF